MEINTKIIFTTVCFLAQRSIDVFAAAKPNYNGPMQQMLGTRNSFLDLIIMYVAIIMFIAVIPFFIRRFKKK